MLRKSAHRIDALGVVGGRSMIRSSTFRIKQQALAKTFLRKKCLLWAIDWPGRLQREDIGQSWYFSIYCLTRRRSPFQIKKNMLQFRTVTKLMTIIGSRKNLQMKKNVSSLHFFVHGRWRSPSTSSVLLLREREDGWKNDCLGVWTNPMGLQAHKLTVTRTGTFPHCSISQGIDIKSWQGGQLNEC